MPSPFPQCRSGRAREGFTGEVIFELGDVFIEVGSEAFCWEGNREQKEAPRRVVKFCKCHGCSGGDGSELREQLLKGPPTHPAGLAMEAVWEGCLQALSQQ